MHRRFVVPGHGVEKRKYRFICGLLFSAPKAVRVTAMCEDSKTILHTSNEVLCRLQLEIDFNRENS